MPAPRLSMRKLREVLRLKFETDLSNRRVDRSCGVSRPSVAEYLQRFKEAGLSWPQAAEFDDATGTTTTTSGSSSIERTTGHR